MRSYVVACAIFAPLASADYMRIEFISASSTCDGNPTSITSNVIGCETDSDGESSYQLACSNGSSATLLGYTTADCSGNVTSTAPYKADFGCTRPSSNSGSSYVRCVSGDFVAPTPAGNTYKYNGVATCPPPADADLTMVMTDPCGTCIDYGNGAFGSYSCDSTSINLAYYSDSSCSGTSTSYPILYTGCSPSSDGSTQVSVNECDTGSSKGDSLRQAAPPNIKATQAPELMFHEAHEVPASMKASRAAALAAHQEAVAKTNEALAAALA